MARQHGSNCANNACLHNYIIKHAVDDLPCGGVLVMDMHDKYHVVHKDCAPENQFPRKIKVYYGK